MSGINRKLISYFLAFMLGFTNIAFMSNAYASDYDLSSDDPTGGSMLLDATLIRAPMAVVTLGGAVVWLVTLPFSALGGNVGEAGRTLVVEPAEYTFVRPLGRL